MRFTYILSGESFNTHPLEKAYLRELLEELRRNARIRDCKPPHLLSAARCRQKVQNTFVGDIDGIEGPGLVQVGHGWVQVNFARSVLSRKVHYGVGDVCRERLLTADDF